MNIQTKVIDNFRGSMTQYLDGDLNSGFSYVQNSAGANPFKSPGNLTWSSAPSRIDPDETVITDLIMAGKERVESGILYVYAIGHLGRLYKIQVNDPATNNPNYDNPVLLTTLTIGSPTFTRGGFMDFFGSTERIYIGHDMGVTRINFDGTSETVVGVAGSWIQTVPRPLKQFIGRLYAGNGNNIAEIDSTATVTDYTKLDPSFPDNTQVRDMDVSPDGTYLQIVVSRLALEDITSANQDTSFFANSESYIFKWNGTDTGYTSYDTFPSFSLTANTMFQNYQYTFGYDQFGAAVYSPLDKKLSMQESLSPLPGAVSSTGNLVTWMFPLWWEGFMETDYCVLGSNDFEIGPGYWDLFFQLATEPEIDVIQTPLSLAVSNLGVGSSSNGYTNNIVSTSKTYFSTLEISATTTKYKFYKWIFSPSPNMPQTVSSLINAIYQTQTQLFSKKIQVKEIRVYGEPWITDNSFRIDLIGSNGAVMTNGSQTFIAGTNLTIGNDFAWYNPGIAPTYALGLWIENLGTANFTINKIEIDYVAGGK